MLGIAAVAGLAVWFATSGNRESTNPILGSASGEPTVLESADMHSVSAKIGHTVFWAGMRADTRLELRHDAAGNAHVRYLTGGAAPGDPAPAYLDIGTYPFKNGYAVLSQMSDEDGRKQVKVGDAVGFYDPERPTNIYLGFPDRPDFQVEVFHPDADGALEIVRSGDIVPMP